METTKRPTSTEYKQTNSGLVIKADAARFELLNHATVAYFQEFQCNAGETTFHIETDRSKAVMVQINYRDERKMWQILHS